MEYDYLVIEAHIRRARQLRSEAVGEMIAAGWQGAKRLVAGLFRKAHEAVRHSRLVHH